jgi:LysM repeat protein
MGPIAKCLLWMAGVIALVSCHNQRMVSPQGSGAPVSAAKLATSYGQSHTSSYPDAEDYRDSPLPEQTADPVRASNPPAVSSTGRTTDSVHYTVVRGDTLFRIGRRYGTTVASLKAANGSTSDLIFPGEVLAIPRGD